MSDVAETKPDPTTQAPEADKPETATTGEGEKTVTEAAADKVAEVAETAKDAAVKTSDNVFSMFGGGPKKEEKPKADEEENDRSGSAKAQKEEKEEDVEADKVSWNTWMGVMDYVVWGCAVFLIKTLAQAPNAGCFLGPRSLCGSPLPNRPPHFIPFEDEF
jgi:hypothetical protein